MHSDGNRERPGNVRFLKENVSACVSESLLVAMEEMVNKSEKRERNALLLQGSLGLPHAAAFE